MAELKTKPTAASVTAFLAGIEDDERRRDCKTLVKLMRAATGARPTMWGPSIVGFGEVHLKYPSGRELDWFQIGFSPRKNDLTLYLGLSLAPVGALLGGLGKHKTGKSCLYLKRLADVDLATLERMIKSSVR